MFNGELSSILAETPIHAIERASKLKVSNIYYNYK
jgi:hypothetical protein